MNIKTASAGSLESNDLLVTIAPGNGDGRQIEIESTVSAQFMPQIKKVVNEVLDDAGLDGIALKIVDKGALDFVIRARLETAIERGRGDE